MINALLKGIMSFLIILLNVIISPINTLIATLFPDISNYITLFNTTINNYIVPYAYYFFSILPPNCRFLIIYYLTFLVSYYTVYYLVEIITNIFRLIRNIKFW